MKKRLPAFLAGMLTTALVCGLTVSALAANGLLTIDVDPSVTIKVNGEVFQPKNEQGEDVMVFKYGGTTYAPVRALAEAYGLKVNFDQFTNMATVDKPTTTDNTAVPADYSDWTPEEEAAYQEFKGMWEICAQDSLGGFLAAWYIGEKPDEEFLPWWKTYCTMQSEDIETYFLRMLEETRTRDSEVLYIFSDREHTNRLGQASHFASGKTSFVLY